MSAQLKKILGLVPYARKVYHYVYTWREQKLKTAFFKDAHNKQVLVRTGSPEAFQDMPLHIQWEITNYCNYDCSYCFQAAGGHKDIHCSLEQAKKAIEHIASANRPSYQIYLMGGEPLRHPNIVEIVKLLDDYLGSKIQVLRLLTNGSFRKGQFEELVQAAQHFPLLVSISVHLEFNKPERILRFVKNYANKTNLELGLMFHPEYFDTLKKTVKELTELRKKYPFYMMISKLREPPSFKQFDSRYQSEHLQWVEEAQQLFKQAASEGPKVNHDRGQEFGSTHFFTEQQTDLGLKRTEYTSYAELDKDTEANFTGMQCCAGTMVMTILPSGRTRGTRCPVAPCVCNIHEENPFKRDDWMQCVACTRPWCSDVANRRTAKFKSLEEAKDYIAECKKKQKVMLEQYRSENNPAPR